MLLRESLVSSGRIPCRLSAIVDTAGRRCHAPIFKRLTVMSLLVRPKTTWYNSWGCNLPGRL